MVNAKPLNPDSLEAAMTLTPSTPSTPFHALATDLVGFPSSTLRVRVTRVDTPSGNVWVDTADLLDVGTSLVLNASQVTPMTDVGTVGQRHVTGLVILC